MVQYEVKDIIKQAEGEDGQPLFRIRWKGDVERDDTWEPEENLQNARNTRGPKGKASRWKKPGP